MLITIKHTETNGLYTLGELWVNGMICAATVEYTQRMLKDGIYEVRLMNFEKQLRRVLAICAMDSKKPPLSSIEAGKSWITSKGSETSNASVRIGQRMIPGCLKNGIECYERLFDRIEKAKIRQERVILEIDSSSVRRVEPIGYWMR